MWKKSDSRPESRERSEPRERPEAEDRPEARASTPPPNPEPPRAAPPSSPRRSQQTASIGPSIVIRGDVLGEEDLVVDGRVEGSVELPQHNVHIGKDGQVKANVHASVVEVEGHTEGDLKGDVQVVMRRSAQVRGNVIAPRVTLEDGCKFRGSIEMDVEPLSERASSPGKVSEIKSEPRSGAAEEGGKGEAAKPTGQKISGR